MGAAPVECDIDDLESTRAELLGQVTTQTIINVLCDQFGITTGNVDIYGDNIDSLVQNPIVTTKIAFPLFFRPNVDLKMLLQRLREESPKKVELWPIHIKGHQDDDKGFIYEEASQPARRNIDMDHLAKTFLKKR